MDKVVRKPNVDHICPLCGGDGCYEAALSSSNAVLFSCREYKKKFTINSAISDCMDKTQQMRFFNLIFEHCLQHSNPEEGLKWKYVYDPDGKYNEDQQIINLAKIYYPRQFGEKTDRALVNLSYLYPEYHVEIQALKDLRRAFFDESLELDGKIGIREIMREIGYLQKSSTGDYISGDGWKRIDELTKTQGQVRQGFVAMAYRDSTVETREAIRRGIRKAEFEERIMDEKQHNNQIVPDMLHEIERSKFLVMDTTEPNNGAYYEAGYAAALGKPVILCCRKKEFDGEEGKEKRPHFDILQQSMIVWDDYDDLENKLVRRIRATVK